MDDGGGVYAVLRDLHIAVFTVPALDTIASSFRGVVVLYDGKLCAVYDCMWYCGAGGNIGQLAVQYIYSGWIDAGYQRMGHYIHAWQVSPQTGLGSCICCMTHVVQYWHEV